MGRGAICDPVFSSANARMRRRRRLRLPKPWRLKPFVGRQAGHRILPIFLALVVAPIAAAGCKPITSADSDDQSETFRRDVWETFQASRDADGLPSIAPETQGEWIEVCEEIPEASSRIADGCASMRATGFPFPIHQVRTLCMFDDPNYGMNAGAAPYFDENRNAARIAWERFRRPLDPQEVCEAYRERLESKQDVK